MPCALVHRCRGSVLAAIVICGVVALPAVGSFAAISPSVGVLDVSVLKPGSESKQSVTLTNSGREAMNILAAKAQCSACTKLEFQPQELASGESTSFTVRFAPEKDYPEGPVQGKILITTSDKDQPHLLIKLTGYVTKTAALVPWELAISQPQLPGSTLHEDLELVNVSDRELRVLYATSDSGGPQLDGKVPPVAANSRQKAKLTWYLPKEDGKYGGNLILYTDHPNLSKLVLPYTVEVSASAKSTSQPSAVPFPSAPSVPPTTHVNPVRSAAPASPQSASSQAAAPALTSAPIAPASGTQLLAPSTDVPAPATQPDPRLVHLELKDGLTLKDLVEVIASQLKLNLVYEESALNVPVAIRLSAPLPEDALLPLLRSVLQAKGFALVSTERKEIWRIVSAKEAPGLISPKGVEGGPEQLETQVIAPKHLEADALATLLKGFVTSGTGQITAVPAAKLLIITDYKTQLTKLKELVDLIDKDLPKEEVGVQVVQIKAAEASPLADRVLKLLSQLSTAQGLKPEQSRLFISPDTQSNQLILIGPKDQFSQAQELIQRFDTAPTTLRVTYSLADEQLASIPPLVNQILGSAANQRAPDGETRMLLAGSTLSVLATEGQHQRIRQLLDQTSHPAGEAPETSVLKAYSVQNRDAAEIQATLRRLLSIGGSGGSGGQFSGMELPKPHASSSEAISQEGVSRVGNAIPPSPESPSPAPSTRPAHAAVLAAASSQAPAQITVDTGTNSLLIAATPDLHRRLADLIQQLDKRQPQVLLEVMLVSVADSDSFSYAVEAALRTTIGGSEQQIGSDLGIGTGALGNRQLAIGTGLNAAIFNPGAFSVFLRALSQTNKAKVLSLPQVLALDNKQALLRSVQQQPFTSVNASNTVATTSFGGFAEAGTTLEITPHIAPADYLNLEYRLEVSSFTGNASAASVPPPRRLDTISSSITVPDGYTVIVGGLSGSASSKAVNKIPGLGDIPILGILGRSESISANSSTFYVFVRPTILRSSAFEDLKLLSQAQRQEAGLPPDLPQSEPQYIR